MKQALCCMVLFGLLIPAPLHAVPRGDDEAAVVLSKIGKKYDSMRDATVVFTQHVIFAVTKAEQSFNGRLLIKRGKKYRVELDQQTIVTDGSSVWTFSPANKQVVIDRYRDDPRSFSPDKVLVDVPNQYSASVLGKERLKEYDTVILKLLPKLPSSSMKWMKAWVDDEGVMRRIQVLDAGENLMTYDISSIKLNGGLSDAQFRFDPPDGVEVLDLR